VFLSKYASCLLLLFAKKAPEIPVQHIIQISFYFLFCNAPTAVMQLLVFVRQHIPDDFSRMLPFIDQLLEDTAVGVLRDHRST